MNFPLKPVLLAAFGIVMLGATVESEAPLRIALLPSAHAIVGVAPGGSIVRRRAIVGTAAATTAVVASTTANASAAAAANANANAAAAAAANANAAAAANANAAAAAKAAPAPVPVGGVVHTLPAGCATTLLNGVEYHRCGTTYYQAAMQGTNLVYVVKQP